MKFKLIILIYQNFSALQQSVKPAWAEMEASSSLFVTMELFGGKNIKKKMPSWRLVTMDPSFFNDLPFAHTLSKWSWLPIGTDVSHSSWVIFLHIWVELHCFALHCSEYLTILAICWSVFISPGGTVKLLKIRKDCDITTTVLSSSTSSINHNQ